MLIALHKYSRVVRRFSLQCLLIHPVVGAGAISLLELKAAEEAVGLVKALDYAVIPVNGTNHIYNPSKSRSL